MTRTHHKRRSLLRRTLQRGAIVSALALTGLPATQALGQGTQAVTPGSQGEGPATTCFWGRPEASVGPLTEPNETYPALGLAPDTNTDYYISVFQLPAGATVTLHGQFPRARFMSFTAYKNVAGQNGIPGNSLVDENIVPDAGSVNPFSGGGSREAADRSFTITISGEVEPASPAPNTLYAGQEGHTGETQTVEVIERIYRADRGLEAGGGVALPAPTYNPVAGSPVSGESEVCSDLSDVSGPTALNESKFGVSPAQYKTLRSELPGTKEPATHPAVNPIRWEKFFNQGYLAAPFYRGTAYEPLISKLSTEATSGLYATPANAYALAYASRLFGPNTEGHNILVLHAKMPTHPATYNGDAVSEDGSTQVRYWSLCNYTGISKGALLEANSACLFDQEVPTTSSGHYTIVLSLPQDRPANARPGCGVAWMNWGTAGDGEGRPDLDALIVRNQLSNPSFAQSIEKVQHPGEEEPVMGEYYPHGTYETQQEFEANDTCAPATPGTPHLTSGSSPNKGAFTLGWTAGGEAESVEGVTFTLEHKDNNGSWATVASGLSSPEYTFGAGSPEGEGSWNYRVKATGEQESAYSAESGAVEVEAKPPTVTVTCPAMVAIGSNASATVTASAPYAGLATDPSGTVAINTSKGGTQTTTATAVSNVGLSSSSSCSTVVGYYVVVSGPVHSISVRSGEAVELAAGATVLKGVSVSVGGALDVEGATIDGGLTSKGAALLRVCDASIAGQLAVGTSTGPVVIGDGGDCAANSVGKAVSLKENTAGVSLVGNTVKAGVTAKENTGGTTVTHNAITGILTVLGNALPTVDTPNQVTGHSKLQ